MTKPYPDASGAPPALGAKLHIVIVNYRSASLAIQCLESVEPEVAAIDGCRVTVVENASGDADELGSAIRNNGWSDWCCLQELAENRGFAAGNNAAIIPLMKQAHPPEYFLLLNPDTIVRPGGLRPLLQFMDQTPDCGIAGSRLEDPDGTVQRSAFRFPSVRGEFESAARTGPISRLLSRHIIAPQASAMATITDWVAGASMIVRREIFRDVGLMDEGFFLYFEEVDFCKRANDAGWKCWYIPTSRVVHFVGRSSGVTDPQVAVETETSLLV